MRYEFFLFPVCFRIVVLFAVVLEIVTQGTCLCVTTPRATSRKTAPFFFRRNKTQSRYFLSIYFLEITYLWRTLRRHARCFLKISLICTTKIYPRVNQKQKLALSWFKPASTLTSKYECWCEFEKDLKVVSIQFFGNHTDIFHSPKCGYCQGFTSKHAVKFKLKCTSHGGLCGPQ